MAAKATNAEVIKRSQKVADMLLTGASRYQVVQYAAETWKVKERQADEYIAKAREIIKTEASAMQAEMLTDHIVRRRRLFNLAMANGDLRTALAISDSEAKLGGLFVERVETTVSGAIDTSAMTPEEKRAYLQKLDRRQAGKD